MWKEKWKGSMIAVVLLSMITLIAACGNDHQRQGSEVPTVMNIGSFAPMFELKDLNGNKVALADLTGEKVYVKYWASWCSICLAGMDELNTLAMTADKDFKVISIASPNFKGEQSEAEFVKWFKKLDADQITVLLDEGGKWAQKFGVRGYPTSYYIGSDGVLVKTAPGHNSNEVISNTFKEIY